jgi:hypothetical protein
MTRKLELSLLLAVLILLSYTFSIKSNSLIKTMKTTLKSGGILYGLNNKGKIYTKEGDKNWELLPLPGELKEIDQIAVNGNQICVINVDGDIYNRNGPFEEWKQIKGKLKNISVAPFNKVVWGVNSNGEIRFRVDLTKKFWERVSGNLKQISVGNNYRVWGVNSVGDIFTRVGIHGNWQHIGGKKLKQISAGPKDLEWGDGRVWGVDSDDDVYTRKGIHGNWQHIEGKKLKQISASRNSGRVWGVDSKNHIFYRDGVEGVWKEIEGEMKYVTEA